MPAVIWEGTREEAEGPSESWEVRLPTFRVSILFKSCFEDAEPTLPDSAAFPETHIRGATPPHAVSLCRPAALVLPPPTILTTFLLPGGGWRVWNLLSQSN